VTAPLVTVTVEQAQAAADALLDLTTGANRIQLDVTTGNRIHDSSGHKPFCWCHNHADADGVFHWSAELPTLRFPLEGETP
jgi:hypothetical protein